MLHRPIETTAFIGGCATKNNLSTQKGLGCIRVPIRAVKTRIPVKIHCSFSSQSREAAMRRLLASCLAIGAICFVAWTANEAKMIAVGDSGSDPAALKADQALQLALRNKNAKAVGVLLDKQFTWTNEAGQTRSGEQFLRDSAAGGASNDTEYADVKARDYGQLAIVTGTGVRQGHADAFFMRIWVKRPAGWRLLAHQSTGVLVKGASSQQAPAAGNGATAAPDCENPCRIVPFTPKTAGQREVVRAYQSVETAVTSHDARTWAYHVADEFVGIGRRYTGTPDTKQQRVGQIGSGSGSVTLPKMVSLRVFVFGDAAIMIADHQPDGERPFHVIRAWVKRDGRWQLFHRQETTIERTAGAP